MYNSRYNHIHFGLSCYVESFQLIDEYTVEDEWHIMDKSEEMMRLEETGCTWFDDDGIVTWGVNE